VSTPLHAKLTTLAEGACAALGLNLVAVQVLGHRALTVQVLAERPDGASPSVEDCTKLSRLLSTQLDVEEVINSRYMLEVSSPGLDRPLVKPADYARFVGKQARIAFAMPQVNPHLPNATPMGSQVGVIMAADSKTLTLQAEGKTFEWSFKTIKNGHLHPSKAELDAFVKSAGKPEKN
jgi:ribosome maturation factor RimP